MFSNRGLVGSILIVHSKKNHLKNYAYLQNNVCNMYKILSKVFTEKRTYKPKTSIFDRFVVSFNRKIMGNY